MKGAQRIVAFASLRHKVNHPAGQGIYVFNNEEHLLPLFEVEAPAGGYY
jgi:hypothetical protein